MQAHIKGKNFIALALVCLLLCGCGDSEVKPVEFFAKESAEKLSMLENAETDYEIPKVYPGITVDLNGYMTGSDKQAFLSGENLPAAYEVVSVKTGETVYRGGVKRKEITDEDISMGYADFSLFDEPGEYYIKAEILGRSKPFEIKEDYYGDVLKNVYGKLEALRCDSCHVLNVPFEDNPDTNLDVTGGFHTGEAGQKDVVEGCLSVLDICTAYEYYPKAFSDDCQIRESGNKIPDILDEAIYEVKWLLKMQNPKTGGVYTSVSLHSNGKEDKLLIGGETTRATAYFCACMARFSIVIQKYDANLSKQAYQAANKAWSCLEANKDIVTADQMFRAAAEMYRASGLQIYNDVILGYLKDNAGKDYTSRSELDGAITYLATPRSTDVTYCGLLMGSFMSRTEDKAKLAEEEKYSVESSELTGEELIRNTFELIVVDYIISNSAFLRLEKDYLHYLGGRNALSENYIDKLSTPDAMVELCALVSKLMAEGN